MAELVLNIVPIKFNANEVKIGKIVLDKSTYKEYLDKYSDTHAFRYDSQLDIVQNIPIKPNVNPLGENYIVQIKDCLPLLARGIQQSIFTWLSNNLRIYRKGKKVIFWGKQNTSLLLTQSAKILSLPTIPNLEVVLKYEIDCRIFRYGDDKSFLGLVIDLATSNIIDIPISELQLKGYNPIGKYICIRTENENDRFQGKLETIGQVSEIDGYNLKLIDSESRTEINANEAFLEPRLENLHEVLQLYYNKKMPSLLTQLNKVRQPISTAKGKLELINKTIDVLKKNTIVLGELGLALDNLLVERDERFPNKITTGRPILLFGAQGRNTGSVPDLGIKENGPYMYLHHERNSPLIGVVCEEQYLGRVEQFLNMIKNGFPSEMWTNSKHGNPFPIGMIGKYRLSNIRFEYQTCPDFIGNFIQSSIR